MHLMDYLSILKMNKRLKLDYKYGLDCIYTDQEIMKVMASPAFEREYNLKYLGVLGNVFSQLDIDRAIEKGKQYNPLRLSMM
jgi:hypothetical protein